MIPIRDSIPCQIKPVVTWTLMAMCIVVFLYQVIISDETLRRLLYQYGMVPIRYSNPKWAYSFGLPPDYYFSFISSLFLHGGWLHIISNMIFMWIFADNIEELMGRKRFLLFYLICGFLANFVQWYSDPRSVIPVVGASGAIAGVLGAYFLRFPYASVLVMVPLLFVPLFFEVPAIAFLGVWVILQIHDATTAMLFDGVPVDSAWWAHLGGFIAGAFLHPLFISQEQPVS